MDNRRGGKFSLGHIIGDPFALATISIAIVSFQNRVIKVSYSDPQNQLAWLIAFISSVIADIRSPYPDYAWWAIAYMLCAIIGITVVIASDAADTYSVAVSKAETLGNYDF